MIDFGFDKIAIIGAVALVVLGPERLPRVARTVGHLLGKAQRYVADVKAEVNRSIELEELKKMKDQFADAARDMGTSVSKEFDQTKSDLQSTWSELHEGALPAPDSSVAAPSPYEYVPPPPEYKHPKKNWRLKRGAVPQWYRARHGVRGKTQSAAARVARHRPVAASQRPFG